MKKQFNNPEIQVMTFSVEDILTTSGEYPEPSEPGNGTPVLPG